ncbi:hypothetical protein SANTM175S_03822 [Streptomyces antimycoticus]
MLAGDLPGDTGLLGAHHQMVDEDAEPGVRAGGEVIDDGGQVVDALQVLHDDAFDAQIVAPDPLHQLRVMAPLDVDASRTGDPRARSRNGDRPRGRALGRTGGRRARAYEGDDTPLEQKPPAAPWGRRDVCRSGPPE